MNCPAYFVCRNAHLYEVCHGCVIDEHGVRQPDNGKIRQVSAAKESKCWLAPCYARFKVPIGENSFSVRAKLEDASWTPWSAEHVSDVRWVHTGL